MFQVDGAGGVPQHLFVHGLLCPSLFRVLFHQLGKLNVDGLYQGDSTKEISALLLCPNPRLNYLWLKIFTGTDKSALQIIWMSISKGKEDGSLVIMRHKLCLCKKQNMHHGISLIFITQVNNIPRHGYSFCPYTIPDLSHSLLLKLRNDKGSQLFQTQTQMLYNVFYKGAKLETRHHRRFTDRR